MRRRLGVTALVLLGLSLGWPGSTADPVYWLTFDSVDHGIVCPADRCVDGYRVALWPAGAVGVGTPVWSETRERWEVQATGATPPYRLPIYALPWKTLATGRPYVWTLTALGEYKRNPSALSAPAPEVLLVVPVRPATEVELR